MQRCVNVIPNGFVLQNDAISKLEEDEKENQISCTEFRSTLQVNFFPFKVLIFYVSKYVLFLKNIEYGTEYFSVFMHVLLSSGNGISMKEVTEKLFEQGLLAFYHDSKKLCV
ncbi:hypothetical protein MKW98_029076 [Papaver atlanticum]|uniref:Uncharacterized protein n=1 Tax=Papaver atlanticum TaxID=357466 RepID=A0AAD4T5A5_9MAGN|nr:hypothetical protein MKW98_029076 [Papaver atlanticum]